MTGRTDAAILADQRRVQRASLRAGLWVGLASVVVVLALGLLTIAALSVSSRADPRPPSGDQGGGGRPPGRVVDLDTAIPIAVVAGLLGALALGLISWHLARRAAAPLAAALAVQRAFVADASHELRTPLTTLSSRIQLAQHRAERGGDMAGALADLRQDAEVLDAVLTDLLLTAESAGATATDSDAAVPVFDVAAATASVLEARAGEAGVELVIDVASDVAVAVEQAALQRALTVLMDNALRYSPRGSTISVTAVPTGRRVDIRVADQGGGIVGIDPERVFDRFARSGGAGEQTGHRGFGLGLALVRDLAHRFGGTIDLERTSAAGTTFLLSLPAARRPPRRTGRGRPGTS